MVRPLALLSLACLLSACGPPKDPPILSLGGQVVRRSDFDRHVKDLESRGAKIDPAARDAIFDSFLEERVLVLEARNRGFLPAGRPPSEEPAAVQKMLQNDLLSSVQVGSEEIAAYYKEHESEFESPERVTLYQILVPTDGEAREVERHLEKDPKSFESLARAQSRSPEAASGGLMGTFSKGELPPELEKAAFGLAPGGIAIVKSDLGYHLLKVEARQPARAPSLEDARDEIREILIRRKSDQSVHKLIQELLARAKVNHEAAVRPSPGA